MKKCELCEAINEPRLVAKNTHAFAVICKNPLKKEHVLVLPTKHTLSISDLEPEEARDFLQLVEEIKRKVKEKSKIDVLMVQNSGVHSTEPHIHFHIIPSQGSFRKLVSTFEGIPARPEITDEILIEYAKNLKT